VLPEQLRLQHQIEFAGRLSAVNSRWTTLPKAIQDTEDMLRSADDQAKPFLVAYREYLGVRPQRESALLA